MTVKVQWVDASVRRVREEGEIAKGHQKYFGCDITHAHYTDCGDEFMCKCISKEQSIHYTYIVDHPSALPEPKFLK